MQFSSIFIATILPLFLCQCSPWQKWQSERAGNEAYKKAGYGVEARYYTAYNVKAISKSINTQIASRKPMPREKIAAMHQRMLYSKAIHEYRIGSAAQEYLKNYRQVLHAEPPESNIINSKAAEHAYFDIDEYQRVVPIENIDKVKKLHRFNRMPMTENTAKIIKKYYKMNHYYPNTADIQKHTHTTHYQNAKNKQNYVHRMGNIQTGLNAELRRTQLHKYFLEAMYNDKQYQTN